MRSFSLSESSSDDVRSIGCPCPLTAYFERRVDLHFDDWGVVAAAVVPSSIRTLTWAACTRASKAGNVDGEVLGLMRTRWGLLRCCSPIRWSGCPIFKDVSAIVHLSLSTFWLSSLGSLSTFRVLWVGSLRTFRLSSMSRYCIIWGSMACSPSLALHPPGSFGQSPS